MTYDDERMDGELVLPNIAAERATLGALVKRPDLIDAVFDLVAPGEFSGVHVQVAETLRAMHAAGEPIDEITTMHACRARGLLPQLSNGVDLVAMYERADTPGLAVEYARQVAEVASRRELQRIGTRALQAARSVTADVTEHAVETAMAAEALADRSVRVAAVAPPLLDDFLLGVDPEADWVVPGLLAAQDRVVLVAGEGVGKSELSRQVCLAVSRGVHPLTLAEIEPANTCLVDLEVPRAQLRRRLRWARERLDVDAQADMRIISQSEGVDLLMGKERGWLLEQIELAAPKVVTIGPIYRMHTSGPNDEEPMRALAMVLDQIRIRTGAALIVEAHAPQEKNRRGERILRPVGAGLWQRWTDIGLALRGKDPMPGAGKGFQTVAVERWRPDREERAWPEMMRRGSRLSWEETVPDAEPAYASTADAWQETAAAVAWASEQPAGLSADGQLFVPEPEAAP